MHLSRNPFVKQAERRIFVSGTALQDQTLHFNAHPTTTVPLRLAPPLPIVLFTCKVQVLEGRQG
ncbi:hypothetical protein SETIT_3G010500v2 [Setaria italica]|uniref:Uncharacterized protein n=2 Tax=Setaria TaxID=4554 RepID=A0A368QA12_SETIT|nr:hypothetical protein SETIT_3G010500v2 [Setaria italica]TKW23814.1 hypothetical protein SEVIR_3G011800v2 [Setaria viridis]